MIVVDTLMWIDHLRKIESHLDAPSIRHRYRRPDSSTGHADAGEPLKAFRRQDLHGSIYGETETE